MQFWEKVKSEIKSQNTTQEWVAKTSGIVFESFRGWISHERLPRADDAVKIASALGVSVEYLVTGEGSRALGVADGKLLDLARRYKEVLNDLESMPEEGRRMAKASIHAMANSGAEHHESPLRFVAEEKTVYVPRNRQSGDERTIFPDKEIAKEPHDLPGSG